MENKINGDRTQPDAASLKNIAKALKSCPQFQRHPFSWRLIEHLLDRSNKDIDAPGVRAADLITVIYGDNKKRTRSNLHELRTSTNKLLVDLYSSAGDRLGVLPQITSGLYKLEFIRNPGLGAHEPTDAFHRFWQPYFKENRNPLCVFSSPLFFRDSSYRYIRDIQVNSDKDKGALDKVLGGGSAEWTASRHYLSAGEVMGFLLLLSKFRNHGVELDYDLIAGEESLNEDRDLIAFGSGRTNWFLQAHTMNLPFLLNPSNITVRRDSKETVFNDTEFAGGAVRYAVLTRCEGAHQGLATTLVGANHGRAAQWTADYLTREDDLKNLLARVCGDGRLPPVFQALFELRLTKNELGLLNPPIVKDVWTPPDQGEEAAGASSQG